MNGKVKEPDFLPFVCYGRISCNACLSRHLHLIQYATYYVDNECCSPGDSYLELSRVASPPCSYLSSRGDNNSRQRFSLFSPWRVATIYLSTIIFTISHDLINTIRWFSNFPVGCWFDLYVFWIRFLPWRHEFEPDTCVTQIRKDKFNTCKIVRGGDLKWARSTTDIKG